MANRMFRPLKGALDNGLCLLAGSWAIGASGAVGTKTAGVGMTLSRNSAGNYTVTFDDKFVALAGFNVTVLAASASDLVMQIVSKDMSARTVNFKLLTGTTATDPASGNELLITVVLKDSAV
jgi:hypothetical protein